VSFEGSGSLKKIQTMQKKLKPAQKKAVLPPQFQAVLREESVFRKVSEEF
jgi:hypothetical protein